MTAKVVKNHWFGIGARVWLDGGDGVIVLRLAWWQLWLEWEPTEKESEPHG